MEMLSGWMAPVLGTALALAVAAVLLLTRHRPRRADLSEEERAELAAAPTPALQKAAWWSLAAGVATLALCAALVSSSGAPAYWNDDGLRLTVMLVFVAGLVVQLAILTGPASLGHLSLDERDKAVLARSTMTQSGFVLLTLAAWTIVLTERFHEQGAVPTVYLSLIFGSVVLILGIGQAVGVLLGYWMEVGHGQG